jgi:hypothetical protein
MTFECDEKSRPSATTKDGDVLRTEVECIMSKMKEDRVARILLGKGTIERTAWPTGLTRMMMAAHDFFEAC